MPAAPETTARRRPPSPSARGSAWPLLLALVAAAACLTAVLGFAAMLPGYDHAQYPLGWLGGRGLPGATGFNMLGLLLPGGLLAALAVWLRQWLPQQAGFAARLGCWLLLFSALGFAAQGLWPLDLDELDAGASRGHASAWMLWWSAFVAGAALLWLGLRKLPQQAGFARFSLLAALALPAAVLWLPMLLAPGHAQRIALLIWFGWWLLAGRRLSRGAA